MKVFISWSGEPNRTVANALRDWLPRVIQSVQTWVSNRDIGSGARWFQDIESELASTTFGIVCLSPEHQDSPWMMFEAGALAKKLENSSFVVPYLIDMEPSDIEGPLTQFQAVRATRDDTRALVHTMNVALENESLQPERLDETFDLWWPRLAEILQDLPVPDAPTKPPRSTNDVLEEVLVLVRGFANDAAYRQDVIRVENHAAQFKLQDTLRSELNNALTTLPIQIQNLLRIEIQNALQSELVRILPMELRNALNAMPLRPGLTAPEQRRDHGQ